MYCYRKHGHNESDEPGYTQPILYKNINKLKPVSDMFADELITSGVLTKDEVKKIKDEFTKVLNDAFDRDKKQNAEKKPSSRSEKFKAQLQYFSLSTI